MSDAREEILVLPDGPGSIGVLTRPGDQLVSPTFVFLNAGWLRKVGPNRLYVRLARAVARRGHGALRFDFPGIGDSPPRTDGLPLHRSMLVETRLAMDTLGERLGEDSFVLVGLCSGADAAYRVALEDSRVTGVVFLDGFPFRTAAWYWHHYRRRLTRLASWRSFLRRLFAGDDASPMAEGGRDLPARTEASEGLAALVDRGTRLLFVYTGGMANYYNHAGQFSSLFPAIAAHERARVAYLPEVNHVFASWEGQDALSRIVESWLSSAPIEPDSVKVS